MIIVATQLMAGVRPPTSMVASLKPLSHPNSNYRYPITKVSFNQASLVPFPQLSLSIPSRNSESRFISVARSDTYDADEFHNKEEKPKPSSAPVNEQQGDKDQLFRLRCQRRLMVGVEGQMLSIVAAPFAYFFAMPTSKATYWATLGGIITAYISLYFDRKMCEHLRLTVEDGNGNIANDPFKVPSRDDVIKHVKWAIPMNLFGLGAIIQGIRGKYGLVHPGNASCGPESIFKYRIYFLQGSYAVVINHLLGLAFSIVLLQWVTKPPSTNMDTGFSG